MVNKTGATNYGAYLQKDSIKPHKNESIQKPEINIPIGIKKAPASAQKAEPKLNFLGKAIAGFAGVVARMDGYSDSDANWRESTTRASVGKKLAHGAFSSLVSSD